MKILSAEQLRQLDRYTIEHEPVPSIELMERAAGKVFAELKQLLRHNDRIAVFCGMGNNGGDGLAIARMLVEDGYYHVDTYVVKHSPQPSSDFWENEKRLKHISGLHYIETENQIPKLGRDAKVVDALFGTGLSRPVTGLAASVIDAINAAGSTVYSVDVPSGLYCDELNSGEEPVIQATYTFTFHAPKFSFLLPANETYVGEFKVLNIGLHTGFADQLFSLYHYTDLWDVKTLLKPRRKFSHKGTYGHALIAAGSYGKTGAAVLAVKAALRGGAGLVSALIPASGYEVMQTGNPEAMVINPAYISAGGVNALNNEYLTESVVQSLTGFTALGVGPGIGREAATAAFLRKLLQHYTKPMVLDADALNLIAEDNSLLELMPAGSILTPHPGEFKRLVGNWENDLVKLKLQVDFAKSHDVVVVLKGAYTTIACPDGSIHFNSTGNPGMAKGGSGDVLTGLLTALLAQGYDAVTTAKLGVFIHGLAGDYARDAVGDYGMNASDIIRFIPKAFLRLQE